MALHGKAHEIRERERRASDAQDRSALLEEPLQLRTGLCRGVRAQLALVIGWNLNAGAAPASTCHSRCGTDTRRKDDHVEATDEVAGIKGLRKHQFERELELLEQKAGPA